MGLKGKKLPGKGNISLMRIVTAEALCVCLRVAVGVKLLVLCSCSHYFFSFKLCVKGGDQSLKTELTPWEKKTLSDGFAANLHLRIVSTKN